MNKETYIKLFVIILQDMPIEPIKCFEWYDYLHLIDQSIIPIPSFCFTMSVSINNNTIMLAAMMNKETYLKLFAITL